MTKTKPPPNGAPAAPAASENGPRELRNIPEIDAKIDAYIQEHPKDWAYLQTLPRDRLERRLILNDVQKIERQQRFKESILNELKRNPEMKQAYETLVKNLPEDRREEAMVQIAGQARRAVKRAEVAFTQKP